jgi:hypothetical protein
VISWSIFTHSLGMVFRNFKQAVRISLVPLLIAAGLVVVVFSATDMPFFSPDPAAGGSFPDVAGSGIVLAVVWLALVVISLWIVTGWHRFVLLEEYPQGWVPPIRFDRILSYFGHVLLVSLCALLALLPVLLISALLDAGVLMIILFAVGSVVASIVFYRLVPLLPAAAIGKPMKLTEAWAATRGANGTILALMVIWIVFNFAVQMGTAILMLVPVLGPVVTFVVTLVQSLVSVSLLTTFYGHYVEGRPV